MNIVQEITSWINDPNEISVGGFERLASVLAITPSIWHPNRVRPQLDEEKRSTRCCQIDNELEYHLAPEEYDARSPNPARNRRIVRANPIRELRSHTARALKVFEIN